MIVVAGLLALAVIAWYAWRGLPSRPKLLARYGRQLWGGAALLLGAALTLRSNVALGGLFAMIGMGLLSGEQWQALFQRLSSAPQRVTRLRTPYVEIEMDAAGGAVRGRVLAGPLAGRAFDELDRSALATLARACQPTDPEGSHLLGIYLDRRFPGWRQHEQADFDPGEGVRARPGVMSAQEAHQILGLEPGASAEQVRRAHRRLIKHMHPDQGGSTYLASRVNEARDVLLRRHL